MLKLNSRDRQTLEKIYNHCLWIMETVNEFNSYVAYSKDRKSQQAIAFSLVQIGELAKEQLSEECRSDIKGVPWRAIISMCHKVVHHYGSINQELVWETASQDIPRLSANLGGILKDDRGSGSIGRIHL